VKSVQRARGSLRLRAPGRIPGSFLPHFHLWHAVQLDPLSACMGGRGKWHLRQSAAALACGGGGRGGASRWLGALLWHTKQPESEKSRWHERQCLEVDPPQAEV